MRQHPKPEYPPDHQAGMSVPVGGSSCSTCRYLANDEKTCKNKYFIKWNGSNTIPGPINAYCSDWYEEKQGKWKEAANKKDR